MNKVIEKHAYAKILSLVGVFDVVRVTSKLHIRREKRMGVWLAILTRWSSFSHTMITVWREFTFTLEDVCVLLELLCLGRHDICFLELSSEEEEICSFFYDLLKSEHDKSKEKGICC